MTLTLPMNPNGTLKRQETFDLGVAAILAQGTCSARMATAEDEGVTLGNVLCMYRGPDGAKCFAGHFVPDAEYDPVIENKFAHTIFARLSGTDQRFMDDLQRLHDYAAREDLPEGGYRLVTGDEFIKQFTKHIARFAKDNELTLTI
jgi:hypothetical protein